MCSNRFCWRSEPVKGLGATGALCRDCWMRRHEALPSVCCWRMRMEANHQHLRQRLGAQSSIPARRRGVPNGAIRNQMFRAFPKKPYRQRAKIESLFSAVNRKLSSRAPGRSLSMQIRQALLIGLAYNLYRLRHRFPQRGCQQSLSVAGKGLMGTDCRLESNVLGWRDFGELEGPHGERP